MRVKGLTVVGRPVRIFKFATQGKWECRVFGYALILLVLPSWIFRGAGVVGTVLICSAIVRIKKWCFHSRKVKILPLSMLTTVTKSFCRHSFQYLPNHAAELWIKVALTRQDLQIVKPLPHPPPN
jgi:hypothetical protein